MKSKTTDCIAKILICSCRTTRIGRMIVPAVALGLCLFIGKASADTIVVPAGFAATDGHDGTLTLSQSARMQEAYGAELFPATTILIREVRFRPSTVYGGAFTSTIPDIRIGLGTTTRNPEGLSSVFSENLGADFTLVFQGPAPVSSRYTGPAGGPKEFDIIFPLATPFVYDPSRGNLIIELRIASASPSIGVDATGRAGDRAGRAYSSDANSANAAGVDVGADIIQFVYGPTNGVPSINSQPQSQTAFEGSTVSFSVTASSAQPLTYQWGLNGIAITDATNFTLTLSGISQTNAGSYSVVVSNTNGMVTSSNAVLTVNPIGPTPINQNLIVNGSFEIGVDLTNTLPISAVDSNSINGWTVQSGSIDYIRGRWVAGDGNRCLDLSGVSAGTIRQEVSGLSVGHVYRLTFLLAGNPEASPSVKSVRASVGGVSQDFSFNISGFSPTRMGWTEKTIDFTATNPSTTLLLTSLTGGQAGPAIDVVSIFPVTPVPGPPVIVYQPQSLTVLEGGTASFQVTARGTPPVTDFQWRHNNMPLLDATNSILNLSNVVLADAGTYVTIVGNSYGAVTSQVATLTVTQPPANVWVAGRTAAGGGEVSVPVRIRANGNENAISFSLSFNKNLLTFSGASLGGSTPAGSALLLNTNDLGSGRIGLGVGLPADTSLPRGTQEVVVITFLVAPVINQTTTTISFSDLPTLKQLSDAHALVLPALYSSGSVSISDSQLEGDLAPRPDGNRSVTIADWVQMGRLVAVLDTIGGSNEFQRADCAPSATKGNGIIGASDWVQIGRYAVGLDPLTIVGGPIEPDTGGGGAFGPSTSGTKLTLSNSSIAQGQTSTVPVMVECQGGENAMTFSVTFDPTKLAFVSAVTGAEAGAATLNPNASGAAAGRIGLALALQPGTSFTAGSREIIQLRFQALVAAPVTTAVAFTNSPVPREVSDVQANLMAASYMPATVTIVPPPGPPIVASRSGDTLYLVWPANATGFELQGTAGALGTTWTTISAITIGDQKLAVVPITGAQRFFRLRKP